MWRTIQMKNSPIINRRWHMLSGLAALMFVGCGGSSDNPPSGTGGSTGSGGSVGTGGTTNTGSGGRVGSGGAPAGSGGAPAGSGGAPAGSGGAPAGSGGAPAGSGGVPAGSGGQGGVGGRPAGSGGGTSTGGSGTAGRSGMGGRSAGTGGSGTAGRSGTGTGGGNGTCTHAQLSGKDICTIGDSWIQITGNQVTTLENHMVTAGVIPMGDHFDRREVSGSTLSSIVGTYTKKPMNCKILVMDGGGIDLFTTPLDPSSSAVAAIVTQFKDFLTKVKSDGYVQHIIY